MSLVVRGLAGYAYENGSLAVTLGAGGEDEDGPCKDGHDRYLAFVDEDGVEHWHCNNCLRGGETR